MDLDMTGQLPGRRKLPHGLPPWVSEGAVYFVTINCAERGKNQLCVPDVAATIHESVLFRQKRGDWWVHLVVLMPDHLHGLMSFSRDRVMRDVVSQWKEITAKKVKLHWQRDFFDHRLRNDENYMEKAYYIRMNPVRKGLCQRPEEWPYAWADFRATEGGGSSGPPLPGNAAQAGRAGPLGPPR